jgi:proteasome lid subunit RPN8/RPN11
MARIPRAIVDEMVAHAREDAPNEACGMVHAKDGVPIAVYRVKNVAGDDGNGSPFRYLMDPMRQFRLEQQRDETGEMLYAIYHSHVASPARPSQTDERQAFFPPGEFHAGDLAYPETYYILVSLASDPPDVKAWRVLRPATPSDERPVVIEEPIEVV